MLIFYIFIIIGLFICLINFRKGFYICLLAGFVQDIIRKLTPGEPVYFVGLCGIFLLTILMGMLLKRQSIGLNLVYLDFKILKKPLTFYIFLVCIYCVISLIRYNNVILPIIGFVTYLTPLISFIIAYRYARNMDDIINLIRFYTIIVTILSMGIFLSFLGYNWAILEHVGPGLHITYPGMMLKAHTGFFRAAEVGAWHLSATACFIVIIGMLPGNKIKWYHAVIILGLLVAILLTGRRKMLLGFVFFISIYAFLLLHYHGTMTKFIKIICYFVVGVIIMGQLTFTDSMEYIEFKPYYYRGVGIVLEGKKTEVFEGTSVLKTIAERISMMGFSSIYWALRSTGVWGVGAGAGSPGSQYFGGGWEVGGGAIESGVGRIVAEMGLIGLFISIWISICIYKCIRRINKIRWDNQSKYANVVFGFTAFIIAQIPTFLMNAIVFGDILIMILCGWVLSFLFSVPRLAGLIFRKINN